MHRHLGRQGVALARTRQLRSQGLVPVHAHRTEGVTGSEGREGSNWDGSEIGFGAGNGDGNGVGGGNRDGDEVGTETGKGVEANEGAQDGDGDGERGRGRGRGWRSMDEHSMGTETGTRTGTRAVTELGTGTGARQGSGRPEERRISARSRTRLVDATWETGETWMDRGKNAEKKGLVQ